MSDNEPNSDEYTGHEVTTSNKKTPASLLARASFSLGVVAAKQRGIFI